MWVDVVPNESGGYDLIKHDGIKEEALATCYSGEGDAMVLATAFYMYDVICDCRAEISAVRRYLQSYHDDGENLSAEERLAALIHNADRTVAHLDAVGQRIDRALRLKYRIDFAGDEEEEMDDDWY